MRPFPSVVRFALLLVACALPVFALRAPVTETATITTPGRFRVEFGHQLSYAPGQIRRQAEQLTLSRGIGEKQQVDVSMPWQIESSTGDPVLAGDVTALYKIGSLWSSSGGRAHVGGFLRNTTPSSTASRTNGTNYTVEPGVLFSQIGEHSLFNLNASALVQTNGEELMRYGASYEWANQHFGLFLEATGRTDFRKNGLNEAALATTGVELMLGKRWTLDAGGSKGITGDAPNWGVHTGASVVF